MPILQRTNARLLRTVRNKQHATEVDHHSEPSRSAAHDIVTPPASSSADTPMPTAASRPPAAPREPEDYLQDPLSSDEEQPIAPVVTDLEKLTRPAQEIKRPLPEDDSDGELFGGSSQRKQTKSSTLRKPAKATIKYGSQSSQAKKPAAGKQFIKARDVIPKSEPRKTATFRAARVPDIFKFDSTTAGAAQMPSPTLSGCSDLSELGFEEIDALDPDSKLKVRCEICREMVDLMVKQEYEDKYGRGKGLNVKRQNAFCKYHKQNEAKQLWKQLGYPEINWNRLDTRMRGQHRRLVNILGDRVPSVFRDELALQIASRQDRTIKATYAGSSVFSRVSTGYYGPRGQKLMLEHISSELSDELREASLANTMISSAGVGGGVSGFVQGVLVPEMAIGLIIEDMAVSSEVAHQILINSRTIGDTLNDEERERVVQDPESTDSAV